MPSRDEATGRAQGGRGRRRVDRDEVLRLHREGLTNTEIARRLGVSRQWVGTIVGRRRGRGERLPAHMIRAHAGTMDALREVAARHGYRVVGGPLAGQGSVSQLLTAIAGGRLATVPVPTSRSLLRNVMRGLDDLAADFQRSGLAGEAQEVRSLRHALEEAAERRLTFRE